MIREGKVDGWLSAPTEALLPWAQFNNVRFNGVTVGLQKGHEQRGSAVIARHQLVSNDGSEPLMVVPLDLILSLEKVQDHAKFDGDLRDVLESLGEFGKTSRGAILTFLLMQCSHLCPSMPEERGVVSPLAEYIKFLPLELLPTFWTEAERLLLTGTTLAQATTAKLNALYREYDQVRNSTDKLDWCRANWWDEIDGILNFDDWLQVDAMYRSRALEFPGIGDCMAPCIDMANHESGDGTSAIYEFDADGNPILLLRPGKIIEEGDGVSITYGEVKGACEMLFSYGFIEDSVDSARQLFLGVAMPEDDPFGKAKDAIAKTAPGFKLYETNDSVDWYSDYLWLMCVNEEDGLNFAIEQTVDGEQELKAFWKDQELPPLDRFRSVLEKEPLWDVFHLRVLAVIESRLEMQLQILNDSEDEVNNAPFGDGTEIRERPRELALRLRKLEQALLEKAHAQFEDEKERLVQSDTVQAYLAAAHTGEAEEPQEDFS